MTEKQLPRKELIASLVMEIRKYNTSNVIFNEGVASKLHLNVTDVRCRELLCHTGPITAGQLSRLTNLTTGAITGVVDRLEKVELVQRIQDPLDRRKVIINPLEHREDELIMLYKPLADSLTKIFEQYNDLELVLFHKFWNELNEIIPIETKKL